LSVVVPTSPDANAVPTSAREAIFISHATPEDNAFTLWLGGKLTALGYQVFADILRLKGGDDWERILEDAIRNKAKRFLLVATPHGVQKQGVRNEITIANETAKRLKEDGFIVPLRLAAYPPPLQIAHAQYINFEKGWAEGLAELIALLEEVSVPKNAPGDEAQTWQSLQLKDGRTVGPARNCSFPTGLQSRHFPRPSPSTTLRAGYLSARRRPRSRLALFRLPRTTVASSALRLFPNCRNTLVRICLCKSPIRARPINSLVPVGRPSALRPKTAARNLPTSAGAR
jgi:TIR domain